MMPSLHRRAARAAILAALAMVLAANAAIARAPQRILEDVPGAIVQLLALADGSVVVVSTREIRRAGPAPAGAAPWPSVAIASLGGRAPRSSQFSAGWASARQWAFLRSNATDASLASWNTQLAGPFDIAAMATAAGGFSAAVAPRTIVRGASVLAGDGVAAARDGSGWVAAYIPRDGGGQVLQKFDGRGAIVPGFEANSAVTIAHAGIERVVAGARSGWWVSGNAGTEPAFADYVLRLRDDGTADPAFGQAGRIGLAPQAAADGHPSKLDPQALLEDGDGILWMFGKRNGSPVGGEPAALAASPDLWLRALSATTGARLDAEEPSAELLASLGPAPDRPELEWVGIPAGSSAPTVCAATATAKHGEPRHELRCLQRGPQGWAAFGSPCPLGGAQVQDVALSALDPRQLFVGVKDQQTSRAALLSCTP